MLPLPLHPLPEPFAKADTITNSFSFSSGSRFVAVARFRMLRGEKWSENAKRDIANQTGQKARYYADLSVWDTRSGQETAHLVLNDFTNLTANGLLLTPDGGRAIVYASSLLKAFDLTSGREI